MHFEKLEEVLNLARDGCVQVHELFEKALRTDMEGLARTAAISTHS